MIIVVFTILLIHGLIHLIGFVHAFRPLADSDIEISKPKGILWLACTLIILSAAALYIMHVELWWIPALIGITLSQTMIFTAWKTSKAGTFINILLLLITFYAAAELHFRSDFRKDAEAFMNSSSPADVLEETDIATLPDPVKKYIRNTGCIGKPEVHNFRVTFSGKLRKNDTTEWMPFTSVQYNFIDPPTRLFFLNATMKHLPVAGYHKFTGGTATMDIRLFSAFTVQEQSGETMDRAETVTFFNDMCAVAPATLIDPRIQWTGTNGDTVFAKFAGSSHTISATLIFNKNGDLVNFISNDRGAIQDDGTMILAPWSTPLKNPKDYNGFRLASEAETVYHYPGGDFCYGTFVLESVEYNCTQFSY